MALFFPRQVLVSKKEDTYGTDITPGNADAVLAFNLGIAPFNASPVERRPATPWFRGPEQLVAGLHVGLEFFVEAAGSGTVDTPPGYKSLLRACGLAETVTASTKVEYAPVSTGHDSVSSYFNVDGQRHKVLGSRGSVRFEAVAGDVPKFHFRMLGLYTGPAASALPAPDFTAYQKPLVVNAANTPTATLQSTSCVVHALEIDLGNNVVHRDKIGSNSVQITGRNPTGRIVIEGPALGTKDWFASAKNETVGALQLIHGTAGGGKVQVDCPAVKVMNPRWADQDGVAMLEMDLNILPSAGNDEIKFTTL